MCLAAPPPPFRAVVAIYNWFRFTFLLFFSYQRSRPYIIAPFIFLPFSLSLVTVSYWQSLKVLVTALRPVSAATVGFSIQVIQYLGPSRAFLLNSSRRLSLAPKLCYTRVFMTLLTFIYWYSSQLCLKVERVSTTRTCCNNVVCLQQLTNQVCCI